MYFEDDNNVGCYPRHHVFLSKGSNSSNIRVLEIRPQQFRNHISQQVTAFLKEKKMWRALYTNDKC